LVEKLVRHHKAFEYFVCSGEGHGTLNPDNQRTFNARQERFLDCHPM
jgi:dipeptidyl aminopeptidase/acylaminoacyl peptidase